MKRMMLIAALVAVAGCGKKRSEESKVPPPQATPPAAPAGSAAAPAPAPVTADDLAKKFDECWAAWNASSWEAFKGCYTPDAVNESPGGAEPALTGPDAIVAAQKQFKEAFPDAKGQPQLVIVNGHTIVGVTLLTGTQTGKLGDLAPTGKKIGLYMAQVIDTDDAGHAKHERAYIDTATLMGQLKGQPVRPPIDKLAMPEQVVIAKNEPKEQGNGETLQKVVEAINKHDAKALGELLADDYTRIDMAEPKDLNKAETLAVMQKEWKAFPDLAIEPANGFAAGDHVVGIGAYSATKDGKKLSAPFVTIQSVDDKGKVKQSWVFQNTTLTAQVTPDKK